MKVIAWIIIAIAIISLIYFLTVQPEEQNINNFSNNQPEETSANQQAISNHYNEDDFSNSQELHWKHMPVTYRFDNISLCGKLVPNRVIWAFEEIKNQTGGVVSFKEDNYSSSGITVYCYKKVPLANEPGYIISGEGGYSSLGNVIINGNLNFYNVMEYTYSPGCVVKPQVEIHEVLHTFGFEHVNRTGSIMGPVSANCIWYIDEDIIQKLKEIYGKN